MHKLFTFITCKCLYNIWQFFGQILRDLHEVKTKEQLCQRSNNRHTDLELPPLLPCSVFFFTLEGIVVSRFYERRSHLPPSLKSRYVHLPPTNEVCESYVFTPVCQSFYSQVGGGVVCLSACWDTHTPQTRHPRGQIPSLGSACWEIRATSRRYSSYWNAYLYKGVGG